jgi:hypothetical protein
MDIEELRSKTKKELLELAKKANMSVKSSISKAKLLDTLKGMHKEKPGAKLKKKIERSAKGVKELAEKKAAEKEVETRIPTYPERVQEGVVTEEKRHPIGQTSVTFSMKKSTHFGQNIFLVGNVRELGNWNPEKALSFNSLHYPTWSATVNISPKTAVEFKFIIKNPDGSIIWERQGEGNRIFMVPNRKKWELTCDWEP